MSQQWGICLRYHQYEASWAALQLADMAKHDGIPVRLYADGVCNRELSPYWDARVTNGKKVPFEKWVDGCTRIIWTTPPSVKALRHARAAGIETVLLADWELLQLEDGPL
jgi:hypothetical protein